MWEGGSTYRGREEVNIRREGGGQHKEVERGSTCKGGEEYQNTEEVRGSTYRGRDSTYKEVVGSQHTKKMGGGQHTEVERGINTQS